MPKVLVAGGCGFLGSHVCELFKSKGWQVISYDNYSKFELSRTGYNVNLARDYNKNYLMDLGVICFKGDIRDKQKLLTMAKGCDYIINCAAQPAMTIALENPGYDADVNIMGTLNILEVARELHIPAALCSTIHVYGNEINDIFKKDAVEGQDWYAFNLNNAILKVGHKALHFTEDGFGMRGMRLLSGQITPLHVSKYASELYARAYIESFKSKVFVARLTGIYGERQLGCEDHGWVANFAIRTLLDQPIKVFGTDKQCRDILYVKDAAQSFLDWYEHGQFSGVYNIGGGAPCLTSIKKCLEILSEITNKKQNVTLEPARVGDLWYFCCDTSKAFDAFEWKPKVLPYEGISKLVNWVKKNEELFNGSESVPQVQR